MDQTLPLILIVRLSPKAQKEVLRGPWKGRQRAVGLVSIALFICSKSDIFFKKKGNLPV